MSDFVHLHVHSHYSLLDALPKVDELVEAAKKQGYKALALTDHGNMYGAIEFYEACLEANIRPIIGVEIYVTPDSPETPAGKERVYHLVLLAKNYAGYRNLMSLISKAQLEGEILGKPVARKDWLKQYADGVIALSGCLEGELAQAVRANGKEAAKAAALEYQHIFGDENFYLELNDLPDLSGQIEVNTGLIELGKELNIPLVVTRDSHYIEPGDAEAQDILRCIGEGRTIDEPDRQTLTGVNYSLGSATEIAKRFKHVPEAIANTVKIANQIDLQITLNEWHFPPIEIPPGKNADEHLRDEVARRLPLLTEVTPEVQARVDYELEIISKKGYSPYFLVVADYVGFARKNKIIETTRGSGAGSIVSYAMGITGVNPLFFKLPFERFLNPFRPSPPDIDADFADDRRDEMIAYVTKKYGSDKVAQIITFGTMMARGAVRDVARALGYSYSFGDQVSKLVPFGAQGFQMTLAKALDLEPDLKELYNKNQQAKRLLDLAQKIEGCARHTSIHAAGVVIAPHTLTDFTPIQRETGGNRIITQYSMHAVEAAGLLKMDFLGIRNLSILGHAVEIVEKTTGEKIDVHNLAPWADKKTYEMLARGETVGVFQLAGSGMTRYLKELKPTDVFDIMAMIALFRPGPMAVIPEYIARKNGVREVAYYHPKMEKFLDKSYGLLVYQDDLLLTAIELAGYDWKTVDRLRKAVGKKIPQEMAREHVIFVKGCQTHSQMPRAQAEMIWSLFEPFQGYGFNKAHAASYAVVAYQTAFLKANYPIQYMTAVLIAESGDIDKVPAIIHECERMGIKVLPPDVNQSFKNFAMIGAQNDTAAHIRFGLQGIKNLGEHIAEVIYRERKENGQYKNLEDFLSRVKDRDLNKKSLESLIKCGALDSFGHDRGLLLFNIDQLLDFVRAHQEKQTSKQDSLFGNTSLAGNGQVRLEKAPPATEEAKTNWEKELLGLYVTAHPFKRYQDILGNILTPLNELESLGRKEWAVVGGVIDSAKKKVTRAGKTMMFVTIQDLTGSRELLVFPKTYETTKDVWVEGTQVCVVGRTSEEEGDDKLFVEKAYTLNPQSVMELKQKLAGSFNTGSIKSYVAPEVMTTLALEGVEIELTVSQMKNCAAAIKIIFAKYPGDKVVYINVGGKRVKTQYKVAESEQMRTEIKAACAGF